MKSDDQIVQLNLERALKALHAVADVCLQNEGKESTTASSGNGAGSEEYLTVRQVAERIKYREQTLRNMMSAGVFKRGVHYFKRRRRVVFLWSSVEHGFVKTILRRRIRNLRKALEMQASNDGDQPFYPVHHARSRKRRQVCSLISSGAVFAARSTRGLPIRAKTGGCASARWPSFTPPSKEGHSTIAPTSHAAAA